MSGRRILLLGHPVEHSLSPAFQQAAFDSIGLPVRYEAMDVAPADLARVVAELRADPLVMGANVTVPHKEKIAPLLDSLTDDAVQGLAERWLPKAKISPGKTQEDIQLIAAINERLEQINAKNQPDFDDVPF